jgi:hypothetical protein
MSILAVMLTGLVVILLVALVADLPKWIAMAVVFVQLIAWVWLWVSIVRGLVLVRSYKKSKGLRCFVCWYEMLPDQTRCPECGAQWDRGKLRKSWKALCEDEQSNNSTA